MGILVNPHRLATMAASVLIALVACVTCGADRNDRSASHATFITQVTVIDVASGREARDRTVVVDGERIVEVRATSDDELPAGATHVDGHGKFLVPGLWDMHVHGNNDPWYADWFPLYIANGVTGVREMRGPPPSDSLRQARLTLRTSSHR